MSAPRVFFADALSLEQVLQSWRTVPPGLRGTLIVLAAIGVLVVCIVGLVVYFSKPRRRHHRHRHHHHRHHHERQEEQQPSPDSASDSTADTGEEEPSRRHRRKWRRRRREHRPLNPTLAETGGLPPVRTGGTPDIKP